MDWGYIILAKKLTNVGGNQFALFSLFTIIAISCGPTSTSCNIVMLSICLLVVLLRPSFINKRCVHPCPDRTASLASARCGWNQNPGRSVFFIEIIQRVSRLWNQQKLLFFRVIPVCAFKNVVWSRCVQYIRESFTPCVVLVLLVVGYWLLLLPPTAAFASCAVCAACAWRLTTAVGGQCVWWPSKWRTMPKLQQFSRSGTMK